MNNTEKTLKNSIISVVAQVATLLLQFINRRVFIIFLDIEYLGYQTLFSNVFSLLSVAEMGIGNIIAFHLYREIVDDNKQEIGKLMYLYKWLYRIVAGVVLVAGIGCYFLLPYFVTDATASWSYLHLIYWLQLASVIAGYFLSYRRTIYIATQQEYKCVQIDLYTNVVIQIAQLSLLAIFRNYIVYLCLQLSTNIIANAIIARKSNREYPYLREKYEISKADIESRNMFSDVRNFLAHQISYAIYGGTDNIIISGFCGVRNVALYGNYALVKKGVMQVLNYKLLDPVRATIGNLVYSDRSKEELWEQFQMVDVFISIYATYIGLGFWIFYQPFIQLWMGKEYLLSESFVLLFCVTTYVGVVFEMVYKYRSVFGDYRQDRNFMIASAVLNIAISVPAAKFWGIPGVQMGTLVAFIPIALGRIRFVVKNYFEQSMVKYLWKHFLLLILVLLEGAVCYFLLRNAEVSIVGFLERGIVWLLVPLATNFFVYCRNPYFKQLIRYFERIVRIAISKVKKSIES